MGYEVKKIRGLRPATVANTPIATGKQGEDKPLGEKNPSGKKKDSGTKSFD